MPIRYLILSLTTRCNLACRYCYNGERRDDSDMSIEVMQRAVSLVAEKGEPFHLQLSGGEPTLVPELIETAAGLAKKSGGCCSMGIQTNGTGLTPELLNVFRANGFQVGVSLDGPPAIHQQQRGMAAETLRGLRLLENASIPFRVTTVVTRLNVAFLDRLVLTLAGFACARGIGLDLLIDKGRAKNTNAVTPADRATLEEGLSRMLPVLEGVNARRSEPIRLREKDLLLSAGRRKRKAFCHACRAENMAVAPSGEIFPCGQTLGDPRFAAGTVWNPQLSYLAKLHTFLPHLPQCATCPLQSTCPGDCPSRLHYNRNQDPPQVCDLYQILWQLETDLFFT